MILLAWGNLICGCGGIGRRARFRFWWHPRAGSSPVTRTILVRPNGCSPQKNRIYGLFSCFLVENFKAKAMDAFFLKSDLDPRQQSELSSDKILSNKSASFEQISLPACRFLWKNIHKVFKTVLSNITKCDKRQSGLFLFLKERDDTHVANILLKKKNKTNGGKVNEWKIDNQHKSASQGVRV